MDTWGLFFGLVAFFGLGFFVIVLDSGNICMLGVYGLVVLGLALVAKGLSEG